MKRKLLMSLVLGLCFALFTSVTVFADSNVLEKQQEVDKYVFEEHSAELAEMGITVTHTSPADNVVEIGIMPFNEENANYFYEVFGKENVKVVEGVQAITFSVGGASDNGPSQEMLDKQHEIDTYFAEHAEELEDMGITFTHSSPTAEFVEVGITPFNEESANYLYGIFGSDNVKIVEGQTATTMTVSPELEKADSQSESNLTLLYILAGAVILAGIFFAMRMGKKAKA